MADTSPWWHKRRGIAVAVCASGNYLGGAIWPPLIQHVAEVAGWRTAYFGMGVFCAVAMTALAPLPAQEAARSGGARVFRAGHRDGPALRPFARRGAGPAHGGGRGLLRGHVDQGVALLAFLPVTGLMPLYVISALFGLFQGGIVPSYAIIVREHFAAREAGARLGAIIMCTLLGMALGGWMSGKVFDLTGSYHAAFLNGLAWSALDLAIAWMLLRRAAPAPPLQAAIAA